MLEQSPNPEVARRVAKNTIAQVARFAGIAISKFLIVVVIARWAGVSEVGDFSFVMTFALTLSFLNHLGLSLLLTREIAQQRERVHEYLGNAITVCLGLSLFSVPVTGLIAQLLGYGDQIVLAVYIVAVAMVLETLIALFNAVFNGFERMELGALAIVFQEIAFVAVGAVVLLSGLPFVWLFVVYLLSRFVGLLASIRIYWRLWKQMPFPRFDQPVIKELLHKTKPFVVSAALSPVFVRIDVLMLSYIKGNDAVGYYEVASTLFYRLNVFARMLNYAMLPLVARQYVIEGSKVVRYLKRVIKYQLLMALPITVLSWVLGDKIILALYGPEFAVTIVAFQIMASVVALRFLGNTLGLTLTAIDLQWHRSLIIGAMAVLNILANLYFLPRYSYIGAAVTSVLTELSTFILLMAVLRTRLPNPIDLRELIKPVLASAAVALLLLLMHDWPLLVSLSAAALAYGLAVVLLRVLTPAEMELFLKMGYVSHLLPPVVRRWLIGGSIAAMKQDLL